MEKYSEALEYFCIEFGVALTTFLLQTHWPMIIWSAIDEETGFLILPEAITCTKNFFFSKKEFFLKKI